MEVLVEAKKEYTNQLYDCMIPVIIQAFSDMFVLAENDMKKFQVFLQEVKHWNQSIIKEHSEAIAKNCPFFTELFTAVMVANVKILSSVRIGSEQKRISIKMPTNDLFVHHCYIACAKNVYYDPDVFKSSSDYEKEQTLTSRFKQCIDITIKDLIPVQQILTTYIGSTAPDENVDLGPINDTEDPEVDDSAEEQVPSAPVENENEKEEEEFFGDNNKWIDSENHHTQPQQPQSSPLSSSGAVPSSPVMTSPTQPSSNQPSSTQ